MKIRLFRLPVETRSGIKLGQVRNTIIDDNNLSIWQYEIKDWWGKTYLVNNEQVVSINEERMIVEDSAVKIERRDELGDEINLSSESVIPDAN